MCGALLGIMLAVPWFIATQVRLRSHLPTYALHPHPAHPTSHSHTSPYTPTFPHAASHIPKHPSQARFVWSLVIMLAVPG